MADAKIKDIVLKSPAEGTDKFVISTAADEDRHTTIADIRITQSQITDLSLASTDLTDTANIALLDAANEFTALQSVIGDGSPNNIRIDRYNPLAAGGATYFGRAAGGTLASPTVVDDGDLVCQLNGQVWDGADFEGIAYIRMKADGAHASGDTPGLLEFATTPSGAEDPTARLTINNAGQVLAHTGPIVTGDGTFTRTNPNIVVDGSHSTAANGRSFLSQKSIDATGTIAYADFDASSATTGTNNYDHMVGLETRQTHGSSGTLDRMQGVATIFVQNGGVMSSAQHLRINDPTGSGTITDQYGLYVPDTLSKATNNYAIWTADQNVHRLGGNTEVIGSTGTPQLRVLRYANSVNTGRLDLQHARGTEASPLIIANNDQVGDIRFKAFDGDDTGDKNADFLECASITALIDGTPSTSSMPGRLEFGTTPSGSTSPTTRFTIEENGNLVHTIPTATSGAGMRVENTDGYIEFVNQAGGAGNFAPAIKGEPGTSSHGFWIGGEVAPADDTGVNPVLQIDARQNDDTAVDTRPLLIVTNASTAVFSISAGGDFDFTSGLLNNVADPVSAQDAVTKAYFEANTTSLPSQTANQLWARNDGDTAVESIKVANKHVDAAAAIDITKLDTDVANATGDTFTGVHDFGGATSLEIPNSATPTVDAAGEIAIDTTVTDWSHGIVKYYSGEEVGVVAMPVAQFTSPTDGYVVSYNATNDEFELAAGGGTDNLVIGQHLFTNVTNGATQYAAPFSQLGFSTSAGRQWVAPFAFTLKNFVLDVSTDSVDNDATATIRINQVGSVLSLTINAGAGVYTDTGDVSVSKDDLIQLEVNNSSATSGSLIIRSWGCQIQ